MRPISIGLFLVAFLVTQPSAQDWPNWGGPDHNCRIDDAGLLKAGDPISLKVAWRQLLGTAYSAIAVADGFAVTTYSDDVHDYTVAFDASDGTKKWQYTIGPAYLGHYGSQSGPVATPLIHEGKVIGVSPQGSLFALDLATGKKLWAKDIVSDLGAIAPFWGFTASPLMHEGRLIVQMGGTEDNAISAFNTETGDVLWSAVSDSVNYQSPVVLSLEGTEQILFHGNQTVVGLQPETGQQLWEFQHGGRDGATSTSGHPVSIGGNRLFVKNRNDGGVLFSVDREDDAWTTTEIWRTRDIRSTYIYPVANSAGDLLFGYNNRILNCVSTDTGERVWRSREPGDGLPIIVDDHLVIITKKGRLSIAPASGEGYAESAGLQLFDDIVWTPASFANGRIYARSMGEIAAIDIITDAPATAEKEPIPGIVPGTDFADWVAKVEAFDDKTSMVDAFMASQESFPIIEGDDLVHFIYRGPAAQVSLTGDLVGVRFDRPMHHIEGTDLWYYSSSLEPDAHQVYQYILNLQNTVIDSLNPRRERTLYFRNASWFAMPEWKAQWYLEPRTDGQVGRIDSVTFDTASPEAEHTLAVYLPHGYDSGSGRYPVIYLHWARYAKSYGQFEIALDNLIFNSVRPVIFVFLPDFLHAGYSEYMGDRKDEHARIFTQEVVPLIDRTYRTLPDRDHRANIGSGYGGFMAFYTTFNNPEMFGKLAIQTMGWDQAVRKEHEGGFGPPSSRPSISIYLDWAKYDRRSPNEGNDAGASTEEFAATLRESGYSFEGGETNDGAGFFSSRHRIGRVFEFLFPIEE